MPGRARAPTRRVLLLQLHSTNGSEMQPPPAQQQQQPESAHRRASSSTCSAAPRRTGVGCMAGILRLFSPYHRSHHRKRLTAKNNAANHQPSSTARSSPPSTTTPKKKAEAASPSPFLSPVKPKPVHQQPTAVWRRRSCDAPRSPTIAPEHRRASCDSPRPPPPAIVARLMGLEESAPPSPAAVQRPVLPNRPPPPPPLAPLETAAEKRRKLLGALEKCDEDLKTLRRIIAAVRAVEMRAAAASDVVVVPVAAGTTPPGNKVAKFGRRDGQSPTPSPSPPQQQQRSKPRADEQCQYPSPDSVLDAISSPRFPCRKQPPPCTDHDACGKPVSGNGANGAVVPGAGTKIVKPSRTFVFSGDYCKTKAGDELHLHTAASAHHHHHPTVVATEACTLPARLPRAAGAESWRHHRRRWETEAAAAGRVINRAMVESVADVWGPQGTGGGGAAVQRWECGGVAAALERAILHDMVSDVVAELLAPSANSHGTGCRKRLCF